MAGEVPSVPDDVEDVDLDFVASSAPVDAVPGRLWAATEPAEGASSADRTAAPSMGAAPDRGGQPGSAVQAGTKFYQVSYYRAFFDVDTSEVFHRIVAALTLRRTLFDELEANPDLYGPFWLATTNVFMMAMVSNALSWTQAGASTSEGEWSGDIDKIVYAAAIFYGYIFGGALALWIWLRVISNAQIALVALWSIYGYSMAAWLPVSFLALIPSPIFLWLLCLGTSLLTATCLVLNVKQAVQESLVVSKQSVTLLVMFLAHNLVGFALRVLVFSYDA